MSDERRFETDAVVLRDNAWVLAAAALPFVAIVALVVSTLDGDRMPLAFIPHLVGAGLFLVATALVRRPWPSESRVRVQATRSGVRIGERVVQKSVLRAGLSARSGGRHVVILSPRGATARDIRLAVADEATAQSLLRVLGLDAAHVTARFRTTSRVSATPRTWTASALGLVTAGVAIGAFLGAPIPVGLAILAILALQLWPATVDVGADGVHVAWLHTRRFLPASDIAFVAEYDERHGKARISGVELMLRDGSRYRIPVANTFWDGGKTTALALRIRDVIVARPTDAAEKGAEIALLERRDEDARAWLERLRGLGLGANATLRTAPVRPEALWRVVADTSAAPRVRVAAAAALGVEDEAARTRLEQIAAATADPRLRVALEAALGDDDEPLARALDELAPVRRATRT